MPSQVLRLCGFPGGGASIAVGACGLRRYKEEIPAAEHMAQSNREITLAIMIEELSALDEIGEIASTEGVDLVVVGPADMSRALGAAGQTDHPRLADTINRVADEARKLLG